MIQLSFIHVSYQRLNTNKFKKKKKPYSKKSFILLFLVIWKL
jgi:hypothetical protein